MKKIIALVLCLLMAVSLAACGGRAVTEESSTSTEQSQTTTSAAEGTQKQEESSTSTEQSQTTTSAAEGTQKQEESSTSTEQPQTTTSAAEGIQQPEESSVPAEPESTFDTSWAGDKYVMPIPEPPFAYEVNVDGAAVEIRSTNGGMNGDVTHQSILDYCEELENAGFTLNLTKNEIGERYGRTCYLFSAKDAAGNNVELIDDGAGVIIHVSLAR